MSAAERVLPDLARVTPVDTVGVEERVARFRSRSIKTSSKIEGLKLTLSMIDLTTLEGADTPGKVRQLCAKAQHLHERMPGLPRGPSSTAGSFCRRHPFESAIPAPQCRFCGPRMGGYFITICNI